MNQPDPDYGEVGDDQPEEIPVEVVDPPQEN